MSKEEISTPLKKKDDWVFVLWGGPPLPPPGHPQGMPLQWYEHASQDDPSSPVGASLVGALGGEGGLPPKDEDPDDFPPSFSGEHQL